MFAQLPEQLKQEVLYHLEKNDFPKAKAIHDAWLDSHQLRNNKEVKNTTTHSENSNG